MKEVCMGLLRSPTKAFLLIALILQICPSLVDARTTQKTLLDVTDKLQVYQKDTQTLLDQVELRQFPYVMAYSKNLTLEGELCYAIDLQSFETDCYEKQEIGTTWIVITPFDYVTTNDILSSAPAFNVEGVII